MNFFCRFLQQTALTYWNQVDAYWIIELYSFQVPGLIKPEFVKPGAIVIDVGINRIMVDGKAKIVGDVDPKVLIIIFFQKYF